ncbi:MAG: acetate kinase [Elusimicrobia bacterium GWC2_65_9]|nr:MAG: acetate kinase [Elusimicrobia bacterium GWA2_66_18]OGR76916.1 MAG: acetate kinase [Elusimicrobia bacterium GWC2_65_9]
MNILVLNSGSSSIKFQVVQTDSALIARDGDRCLAKGQIERIGSLALVAFQAADRPPLKEDAPLRDYRSALDRIVRWVISPESGIEGVTSMADIHIVGHRVVHGGEKFRASTLIDDAVLAGIEDCIELAPLHNPANVRGIRAAREVFGRGVPQVAVFDTSFHATMPETAYLYGIPYHLYRRYKIRRYGFHGTSHRYLAYRYRVLNKIAKEDVNIITLHLGNGCSACAIKNGESVNTSMGFTPLEGMVMGTRAGDVDVSVIEYLSHKEGLSLPEMITLLNKQSGLLGLSGLTSDMRELLEEEKENGDRRASLAIDVFCASARRRIGAYLAELGGADALVFSGGIGENSPVIRQRVCRGLEPLGIVLDEARNAALKKGQLGRISKSGSRVKIDVIATNEELLIARDAFRAVSGLPQPTFSPRRSRKP